MQTAVALPPPSASAWKPPKETQPRIDRMFVAPKSVPSWSVEFGLPPDAPATLDFRDTSASPEARFLAYTYVYLAHCAKTARVAVILPPDEPMHVMCFPSHYTDALSAMAVRGGLDPVHMLARATRDIEDVYTHIALATMQVAMLRANKRIHEWKPLSALAYSAQERADSENLLMMTDLTDMEDVAKRHVDGLQRKGMTYITITPKRLVKFKPSNVNRTLGRSPTVFHALTEVALCTYLRDATVCKDKCPLKNPMCARLPATSLLRLDMDGKPKAKEAAQSKFVENFWLHRCKEWVPQTL